MSERVIKYKIGDILKTKVGNIIIDGVGVNDKNRTIYYCKCDNGHCFTRFGYALNSCPVCSGRNVIDGINDMHSTNQNLFNQLVDKEFGHRHAQHSNKKTNWICPDCGNIINNKSPNQILRYGYGCNNCSDGISYPEKFMTNLLSESGIEFIYQYNKKHAEWCGDYKYDFYIPKFNVIIEVNGLQHYKSCQWHSYDDVSKNDKLKRDLAERNVSKYIVIDARYSNRDFLKQSIMRNDDMYDILFSNIMYIKWKQIDQISEKSKLKSVALSFNDGVSFETIMSTFNIGKTTLKRYLNRGTELGFCNYNPKLFKDISTYKLTQYNAEALSLPIVCNENNMVFKSANKCELLSEDIFGTKLDHRNISAVLKGKRKHTKHFTFSYITKEQFNKFKLESPELVFGDIFELT